MLDGRGRQLSSCTATLLSSKGTSAATNSSLQPTDGMSTAVYFVLCVSCAGARGEHDGRPKWDCVGRVLGSCGRGVLDAPFSFAPRGAGDGFYQIHQRRERLAARIIAGPATLQEVGANARQIIAAELAGRQLPVNDSRII